MMRLGVLVLLLLQCVRSEVVDQAGIAGITSPDIGIIPPKTVGSLIVPAFLGRWYQM
jgi:hypothetical protein